MSKAITSQGLLYKEDWEETRERFKAWWAHESFGRCALAVTAPREHLGGEEPACPATPEARWTDLDYLHAFGEYRNSRTFFGGEAFPVWSYGYPGHKRLAAFLGCDVHLDMHTGWLDPVLIDEDILFSDLEMDPANQRWQFALQWLKRGAQESPGRSIPAVGAFGGSGDTLAALRGTDRLLFDVMDRPDQVRAADQYIMDLWCRAYDEFYAITREAAGGSTCWFGLWSPGKFYAAQNDFSYMLSTEMFVDLFLPTIEKQTLFLDHCVYHVDGEGAFPHVGALCELPRLQALQILPGAGKPGPLHYMAVLKQVQAAGKNLHISIPAQEVEQALSELSATGLFIQTHCDSEAEARALLDKAEKWSRP
ncbi:hypothetical protein ACFL4W_03335 [Planctomycetota bacterium]